MKKQVLIFLFGSLLVLTSQAQTLGSYSSFIKDPTRAREHPVDFIKMTVDVKFEPKSGLVIGKVDHLFTPLLQKVDSIWFDGPGIKIKKALLDGKELKYKTYPTGIVVYPEELRWDKNYTITFEYEAQPKKGIYFIGWNENVQKNELGINGHIREQIWTQGQGTDNRYWIPSYDEPNDKIVSETYITFQKDFNVLSNGLLKDKKENKDGTITWHYAMSKPHASYLIMIAVDRFGIKKSMSKSGVPVQFWYYPEFPDRVTPTSLYTEQMVDFMEQELMVKYPWESYSQVMVQDFIYGAMENTTATIFGDFFNVDARGFIDRNYLGVNMHEFTHQWFGDLITARSYNHQWLQESFATHYPKYFFKNIYGEDYFQWQRRGELNSIVEAEKKDRLPIVNGSSGTSRVYQKGSAVLDMLRYVLGNDQYRRAIAYYLGKHGYKNVETHDLEVAIQESSGKNLDWFFDEWLYRGGIPHYEVKTAKYIQSGQNYIQFNIRQNQLVDDVIGYFKMPVVFDIYFNDGSMISQTEWVEGAVSTITIPIPSDKEIAFCLFDPNAQIIKLIDYKKSLKELLAQAKSAKNMIDRFDALMALRDYSLDEKRETLYRLFETETFFAIRAEIVNQLAKDKDPHSILTLEKAMQDPAVQVRQAALSGPETFTASQKQLAILLLKDSSYNIIESALEKLYNLYPTEISTWLEETKNVYGMANNVRIKWLSLAYQSGDKNTLNELIGFASGGYEFRTRINAMSQLKSLAIVNDALLKNIFSAIFSWNSRLAGPAAECLNQLATSTFSRRQISEYMKNRNWTEKEKEILKEKNIRF